MSTKPPNPASGPLPRSKRRPALDGIRALSVLAVMVYHANPAWLSGGFLSVNVFFVLSGYLITGILLKETARRGAIDLAGFYKNRARRLLPALFVVIIAVTAVGSHLLTDNARAHLRGDALSTLFYVANWRFILEGESYFGSSGDPSPFRHMWTLAIEEQFYFVFPLLMLTLIALMRGSRRRIAAGFVALIVLSGIWQGYVYLTQVATKPTPDPSRIYYGTDTRANELLLGAALAVAMTFWSKKAMRRNAERLTWVGIAAFVGMIAFFVGPTENSAWVFLGGSVLFSVLICLIIVAVEAWPGSLFADLLSWRPIVWIGELSYGIYLWHWPIFVFLNEERTGWNEAVLLAVRLALTLALATVSYYVIEQPIRTQKLQRRIGRVPSIAAWTIALPIVVGVVMPTTSGIKSMTDAKAGSLIDTHAGSGSKRISIIGDSVGYGLAFKFSPDTYPGVSVAGSTKIGCGTAEQWLVVNGVPQESANHECDDQFTSWQNAINEEKPQVVLWSLGGWDVFDHYLNGKIVQEESPEYATYFRGLLERGLKLVGPDAQVFIPKVPCYGQPRYIVEGQDLAPNRNDPKRAAALNRILEDFAKAHPKQVHLPDPASWLCPNGAFVDKLDGKKMRDDGVHYTDAGATRYWKWLMPQLQPYLDGKK